MAKNKTFPVFAVILLLVGIAWALSELGVLVVNIPWLPIILIVIAVGMIFNRLT